MTNSLKLALIAGCALTTASAADAAVTVSSTAFGLNATPAGATVVDFEPTGLPTGFSLIGGQIRNYSDGQGAEPAISANTQETSYYLTANAGDSATLTSTTGYRTVSLYWGSIDDYNTLTLLDRNGGTIQSFTGMQVGPPANGDQGAGATNRRVTFTVDGATSPIYGLRFASTSPAFEVDNVAFSAAAVPEPATWAMMIFGFGAVGAVARRRRATLAIA